MTIYKKIIALLMFAVAAGGCSAQKETTTSTVITPEKNVEVEDTSEAALDYFINGSVAESKGDYNAAVEEFNKALLYDSSGGIYYALAKNYFFLEKIPLALQNAKKSVEKSPDTEEYYDLLADIFTSASQFDSAAAALNKLISLDSSNINAYYKLARIYENKKPLQAIALYNKVTDIIGPDWSVLVHVGELYEKMGDIDKAAESLERLLSIDPANTGLKKLLIELYQRGKKYDKALEVINDILEFNPDDIDTRERKAQIYIARGDWNSAAKEYHSIVDQPDVTLPVKLRLGEAFFLKSLQDSTLNSAVKNLFKVINKDTTNWQTSLFLGAVSLNEKNEADANRYFDEASQLAGNDADGWVRLGGIFFDNHKFEEAAKVEGYAVKKFPENFAVNLILGLSLAQNSKTAEAKPYLQKAVELNSADLNALSAYAFTLNQLKERDEAVKYINLALAIKPDDVSLLGTLGLIYNNQGKMAESDSVYEKALKVDSMNALVNNNYAYSLSERGVQLDRALKMIKIALEADSANSSYLDTAGWIYFKLGEYEKAKMYIQNAIDNGGENAEVLEHLGDTQFKLGEKELAAKTWRKALSLDSSNEKLKTKIEKGEI